MIHKFLWIFLLIIISGKTGHAQEKLSEALYKNPKAPVETRVQDLLNRMTLEEKIGQMRHIHSEHYDVNGKPDLIKLIEFTKGVGFGCMEAFPYTTAQFAMCIAKVQKHMVENTRLGIPIIPVAEALHGTVQDGCTIYPQAIALGSTFNPRLVYQMAQHIAGEAKAMNVKQVLAPDLDLARELRWGRVEETYGEDPFLVGQMGVAYVKGFRENNIICTPKHFVGHGSPLGGLNLASVEGGEHALFSLYLPPFEKVLQEADPLSVMNCYGAYDNVPVTGSKYFMTDILRGKLGFKGYVYSDWGSVSMLSYFHRTAIDGSDAARQSVEAGVDLEAGDDNYLSLEKLVKSGNLDVKYIDQAVSNILYTKFASGLFDQASSDPSSVAEKIHTPESVKLAKQLADESIVLLKNENQLLPLSAAKYKSIAVIGPNADQVQFGDYSWSRSNKDGVTPLKGIKSLVGNQVSINYAKGCDLVSQKKTGFEEAIQATAKSDVALVFVGSQSASLARDYSDVTSGEGFDLSDLKLPGVQEELVQAIHATGKPVVVVLVTGKPFGLSWEKQNIPAIAVQWYGGEQQGNAIADMLFGITNPSAKLSVSFPQSVGHLPVYYNYLPSDKGYYKNRGSLEKTGRDYVFSSPDALYSFGHGLSYTNFNFSKLQVSKETIKPNEILEVSLQLTNTGTKDGAEVVQLYVKDLVSSVVTPIHQLKGFNKVFVKAGDSQMVQLQLPIDELFLYDQEMKRVVEPGEFEIQIGSASDKILLKKTITVTTIDGNIINVKSKIVEKATAELSKPDAGVAVSVSGIIRDVQATVLPDVEIKVKGSGKMAKTNDKGEYTIKAKSTDFLLFSKKGYVTQEVKIGANKVIHVKLAAMGD